MSASSRPSNDASCVQKQRRLVATAVVLTICATTLLGTALLFRATRCDDERKIFSHNEPPLRYDH
jgi:hypothetical protein